MVGITLSSGSLSACWVCFSFVMASITLSSRASFGCSRSRALWESTGGGATVKSSHSPSAPPTLPLAGDFPGPPAASSAPPPSSLPLTRSSRSRSIAFLPPPRPPPPPTASAARQPAPSAFFAFVFGDLAGRPALRLRGAGLGAAPPRAPAEEEEEEEGSASGSDESESNPPASPAGRPTDSQKSAIAPGAEPAKRRSSSPPRGDWVRHRHAVASTCGVRQPPGPPFPWPRSGGHAGSRPRLSGFVPGCFLAGRRRGGAAGVRAGAAGSNQPRQPAAAGASCTQHNQPLARYL